MIPHLKVILIKIHNDKSIKVFYQFHSFKVINYLLQKRNKNKIFINESENRKF